MEKLRPRVGDAVVYHDNKGRPHNALIIIVWEVMNHPVEGKDPPGTEPTPKYAPDDLTDLPLLNLVHVSGDENRQDTCGRQTEKPTSVPHGEEGRTVHGYYWRYPWETPVPYREPSDS